MEKFSYHDMDGYYIVFERPGLQEFLDYLFANYIVSVWTAATKDYAILEDSLITAASTSTEKSVESLKNVDEYVKIEHMLLDILQHKPEQKYCYNHLLQLQQQFAYSIINFAQPHLY